MNRATTANAVRVGAFTSVALVVVAYLILKAEDLSLFAPEGRRVDALFDSVAGLDDKAAVRVAGVRVGRVDGISLEGSRARVTLLLEVPVELHEGASASIANLGLLGEKYVEILPGSTSAPPLAAGTVLAGQTPTSIDEVLGRLSSLGDSLGGVTSQLTGDSADGPLAALLDNLEALSADLRELVASNREQLDATVESFRQVGEHLAGELPRLSGRLESMLADVQGAVGENRSALRESLENVRVLTENVKTGVDNLNVISGRLARGEGSLGKLLASDEAHDELVSTLGAVEQGVESLSETLGRVKRLQLDLSLSGFYLEALDETHGEFSLDLDPQSGRLYRLALVDDPRGRQRERTETVTVEHPDGRLETTETTTTTVDDKATLSALFGAPFGERFRLWGGLVESTFGAQVDFQAHQRFRVSVVAFDFGRDELDPHLRLTGEWRLHPNVSLLAGVDDPLNGGRDSFFLGAGVSWGDDDLKYLMGSLPRF